MGLSEEEQDEISLWHDWAVNAGESCTTALNAIRYLEEVLDELLRLQSLWAFGGEGKYWTHPATQMCTTVEMPPHVHYGKNMIIPVTEWTEPVSGVVSGTYG